MRQPQTETRVRHDQVPAQARVAAVEEWQQARDELLKAEREATHVQDASAARRRRLPMMPVLPRLHLVHRGEGFESPRRPPS
ncbi:MAG: DUF899 domain-containing protein [Chloroflexi bacterium]|nr:DUF899 domain-containing protein [Chloroflexota bacterium]